MSNEVRIGVNEMKIDMKRIIAVGIFSGIFMFSGCEHFEVMEPDAELDQLNELDGSNQVEDEEQEENQVEVNVNGDDTTQEATDDASGTSETEAETDEVLETNDEDQESEAEEEAVQDESSSESTTQEVSSYFVNQFSSGSEYEVDVDVSVLDSTETSWSFRRNTDHLPTTGYQTIDLSIYGSYFIQNTEEKVIYLTFDEGYEKGFTPSILDTLQANGVKATFFITGDYIDKEPELVKRMVEEGHLVGNHTENHPNMATISDETLYNEITILADKFKDLTGREMDPFLRPPGGKYSEKSLYLTRKLGYRTIFWSMAYKDWETDNQPGKQAAYDHVMSNYHNGAIILLHAVSESNTQALDDILKDLIALGYRFGSLYELE